jgi:hypothetical protein
MISTIWLIGNELIEQDSIRQPRGNAPAESVTKVPGDAMRKEMIDA